MNDNIKNFVNIKTKIAIDLTLVLVFSIFIAMFCFNAAPIADDWSFYTSSMNQNFFDFLNGCMHHTGRLGQWTAIYVMFNCFGMNAVRIFPFLMYLVFGILLTWTFLNFNLIKNKLAAIASGYLASAIFLFLLPSLFDSFLWFDSSASYMMSIIFLLLSTNLLKLLIDKKQSMIEPLLYIVTFFAQFFSEPTSIIIIGYLFLITIFTMITKKKNIYRYTLPALIVSITGFLYYSFPRGQLKED